MSVLRKLAVCYLISVSAFGLAASLRARPDITEAAARLFEEQVRRPAVQALARLDRPASDARVVLALAPPGPADGRTLAHVALPRIARPRLVDAPPPQVALTLDQPVVIAPDLPPAPRGEAGPAAPRAEAAPRAPGKPLTPDEARARAHLAAVLTPEMRRHFDLFLFVSKAARGPSAQRMYVFAKREEGLSLLYDWAASTGRERAEVNPRGARAFTATPAGLYQFDPGRMYRQYRSYTWDQDMPYAMFFNWQRDGLSTGLAIHAASGGDIARLGARASAGCVHLAPENARTLFDLVRTQYRGKVPRFAIDGNDTMSNTGRFARKADGSLKMADGYRVLIDIEDYSGDGGEGSQDAFALF